MHREYTVLIIDDSRANRAFLSDILQEDGYRVIQADNGESGLLVATAEQPALILLDVVMPGIDGFETLRRLKGNRQTNEVAVIMLTATDDQNSKLKAFEYGAVDYIIKSTNKAEVRARVRVHIRLAMANKELLEARAASLKELGAAQQSMLVKPADLPEANFSVYYRSLHEAGGDFYEVLPVGDGVHLYFLADVAGHDIATSYITPAVKVLLKQYSTPVYSMDEAMASINDILAKTVMEDNYLTAFALRINRPANKAVLLGAGHPPAIYIPKVGPVCFVSTENSFMGMLEGTRYLSKDMEIQSGDRFLLYTDGLVEGSENKTAWTEDSTRLLDHAEELRALPLQELPYCLVQRLEAQKADDDVAVLAIEV
ncbi:MAG: fused response regulator/phosphatase [Spirochaetes bacterium]|nr:fused response regulator/phosphatase [Spirochaetota bacterium]